MALRAANLDAERLDEAQLKDLDSSLKKVEFSQSSTWLHGTLLP